MYTVIFYEKRDILLTQFRETVPAEGEGIKVKGKKGSVVNVEQIDDKTYHVHIEAIKK